MEKLSTIFLKQASLHQKKLGEEKQKYPLPPETEVLENRIVLQVSATVYLALSEIAKMLEDDSTTTNRQRLTERNHAFRHAAAIGDWSTFDNLTAGITEGTGKGTGNKKPIQDGGN